MVVNHKLEKERPWSEWDFVALREAREKLIGRSIIFVAAFDSGLVRLRDADQKFLEDLARLLLTAAPIRARELGRLLQQEPLA